MIDNTPPHYGPARTVAPTGTEPADVVRLTKALLTLDAAARHCTTEGRHYAGVRAGAAFLDLLHATRVALANPSSRQARTLRLAVDRFDGITGPAVPASPSAGVVR